jgi:hypothetical protein
MEGTIRSVRSYKKKPVITVPDIPDHVKRHLPSPSSSSLVLSPNDLQESSPAIPLSPLLGSPFNMLGWMDGSSSQPRLIRSHENDTQKLAYKFERMEALLKESGFDSVGELLSILFFNPCRISGESDPRGSFHAKAVCIW